MLCIQYRMHQDIRTFPSNQFYSGKLQDAPSVVSRVLDRNLEVAKTKLNLQPVMFFDLQYGRESQNETSKQN